MAEHSKAQQSIENAEAIDNRPLYCLKEYQQSSLASSPDLVDQFSPTPPPDIEELPPDIEELPPDIEELQPDIEELPPDIEELPPTPPLGGAAAPPAGDEIRPVDRDHLWPPHTRLLFSYASASSSGQVVIRVRLHK